MSKGEASIKDWEFEKTYTGGYCLRGTIVSDGSDRGFVDRGVRTSNLVSVDFEKGIAETQNTIYTLVQIVNYFKIDFNKYLCFGGVDSRIKELEFLLFCSPIIRALYNNYLGSIYKEEDKYKYLFWNMFQIIFNTEIEKYKKDDYALYKRMHQM